MENETEIGGAGNTFLTTPWTEIINVKSLSLEERRKRLGFLISHYWKPVYFFIRRSGKNIEESKDLTQHFFTNLLEIDLVKHADSARGRFRFYLLKSVSRFIAAEHEHQNSSKSDFPRGTLFLKELSESELPSPEPVDEATPEKEFNRQWVISLLNTVVSRLEGICRKRATTETFTVFRRRFVESDGKDYGVNEKIAQELGIPVHRIESHYKKALRWYRHLLREEISRYVEKQSEIEEEIRDLWGILG